MPDYWWADRPDERYWVEIRKIPGVGKDLRAGLVKGDGMKSGAYELLDDLMVGDIVYHWHATQSRFVGRSVVETPRQIVNGERFVKLRDFNPLVGDVELADLRNNESYLYDLRERLKSSHPKRTLYLPFQFRSDGIRMVSYYFGKLPREFVAMFFGESGWADFEADPPPEENGMEVAAVESGVHREYLQPFRPKADSAYVALTRQRVQKRGRKHETLVNDFSDWLAKRGLNPGRNRAIDIGLTSPPVIVEAKMVSNWPSAIRQAVGQLYEYRHFQVVPPKAKLVFLASEPVPEQWATYLEGDRDIAVAWRLDSDFHLTRAAAAAFGLPEGT